MKYNHLQIKLNLTFPKVANQVLMKKLISYCLADREFIERFEITSNIVRNLLIASISSIAIISIFLSGVSQFFLISYSKFSKIPYVFIRDQFDGSLIEISLLLLYIFTVTSLISVLPLIIGPIINKNKSKAKLRLIRIKNSHKTIENIKLSAFVSRDDTWISSILVTFTSIYFVLDNKNESNLTPIITAILLSSLNLIEAAPKFSSRKSIKKKITADNIINNMLHFLSVLLIFSFIAALISTKIDDILPRFIYEIRVDDETSSAITMHLIAAIMLLAHLVSFILNSPGRIEFFPKIFISTAITSVFLLFIYPGPAAFTKVFLQLAGMGGGTPVTLINEDSEECNQGWKTVFKSNDGTCLEKREVPSLFITEKNLFIATNHGTIRLPITANTKLIYPNKGEKNNEETEPGNR